MPDGPRYDDDFYAWTQYQAEVLRTMPATDNRFDREHVAEEIDDLGRSERSRSDPAGLPLYVRTGARLGLASPARRIG